MEEWKIVREFPIYEVSNLGRVRSISRTDSHGVHKESVILKPQLDGKKNYYHVTLVYNGKRKIINVHRLVAKAFIENPNNYNSVNHKDENKRNNAADNLEWCTTKYNNNYGSRKGIKQGVKHPMCKIDLETVAFIKKNHISCGGNIKNSDLAKMFNLSVSHVSGIAHGRYWNYDNSN
jgi:hypothetical protein